MGHVRRLRPSPAMIVAIIALVLSLGGTSYAAIVLPANSVGTKQIKKNAVTGAKVKNGSLSTSDISSASLSKLGRVAINSHEAQNVAAGASARVAVVTLTAPTKGFVLVNGWVTAAYPNARWTVRVWDDGGGADAHSPWYNAVAGTGGEVSGSNTAVFPVAAGAHNFSVRIEKNSATNSFDAWGTITALFIPYNGVGTKTTP
jgi:hypothetical protein